MADPQADLLTEIERFLSEKGIAETTFGLRAANDGKFVGRLRARKRMWPETIAAVREYIHRERVRASFANPDRSTSCTR